MDKIQKWELAGVPAAIVFEALHRMGTLEALGVTAEQLPHVMVLAFVLMAAARAGIDYAKAAKAEA